MNVNVLDFLVKVGDDGHQFIISGVPEDERYDNHINADSLLLLSVVLLKHRYQFKIKCSSPRKEIAYRRRKHLPP